MNGDLVVDILRKVQYVRYLPHSKRWVGTDRLSAHGVMSSDVQRIYPLCGSPHACSNELTSVFMVEIDEKEYEAPTMESQNRETEELRNEIDISKSQLDMQSSLLQQILAKLQEQLFPMVIDISARLSYNTTEGRYCKEAIK